MEQTNDLFFFDFQVIGKKRITLVVLFIYCVSYGSGLFENHLTHPNITLKRCPRYKEPDQVGALIWTVTYEKCVGYARAKPVTVQPQRFWSSGPAICFRRTRTFVRRYRWLSVLSNICNGYNNRRRYALLSCYWVRGSLFYFSRYFNDIVFHMPGSNTRRKNKKTNK